MGLKYLLIDDTTGRKQRGAAASGITLFQTTDFTVGGGGQSTFGTLTGTFTAGSLIEVFRNGILMREGAGFDFQRNVGAQTIVFNYTVLQNAWVRVNLYS